jgi:hypothetical protein
MWGIPKDSAREIRSRQAVPPTGVCVRVDPKAARAGTPSRAFLHFTRGRSGANKAWGICRAQGCPAGTARGSGALAAHRHEHEHEQHADDENYHRGDVYGHVSPFVLRWAAAGEVGSDVCSR